MQCLSAQPARPRRLGTTASQQQQSIRLVVSASVALKGFKQTLTLGSDSAATVCLPSASSLTDHELRLTEFSRLRKMAPANDLTYSFTTPGDRDEILHFYEYEFVPREPMAAGIGLTWDYQREWITSLVDHWCACEASVIARDPAKGNKLVAVRLCRWAGKDSRDVFWKTKGKITGKMRVFLDLIWKVMEGFDPFEDEAVDKVLQYVALGVAEGYSGRGIAYKMCEMSERRGKELGAQYVRVQATNIMSQRIFQNMGFEIRDSIDYATYEVDGEKVLDMTRMGDTTCLKAMVKRL